MQQGDQTTQNEEGQHEQKQSKRDEEGRKQNRLKRRKTDRDASSVDNINGELSKLVKPPSEFIISSKLREKLQHTWRMIRSSDTLLEKENARGESSEAVQVPPFRVGTLEMYKRFPKQYDLLMRRHNCEALQDYLHEVLTTLQRGTHNKNSSNHSKDTCSEDYPSAVVEKEGLLHVLDFGCGTGRIASMICRHKSVGVVYCYDAEESMLRECIVNVVRTIAESRPDVHGVRIHRTPDTIRTRTSYTGSGQQDCNNNNNNNSNNNAGGTVLGAGVVYIGAYDELHTASPPCGAVVMDVCVRSVTFATLQRGLLSPCSDGTPSHFHTGNHNNHPCGDYHPRVDLVSCAWALSYVMRAAWGGDRWHAAVDATVRALRQLTTAGGGIIPHSSGNSHNHNTSNNDCANSRGSAVVVVETLGTDAELPTRHNTLADRLEMQHAFERRWVRCDFNFRSPMEAVQLTRFFFGDAVARRIEEEQRTTLPECTGIWTQWGE